MSNRRFAAPIKGIDIPKGTYKVRAIATEAMSFYQPNLSILNKLSDTYDSMAVTLKKQVNNLTELPDTLFKSKIERVLEKFPYTELMDLNLPCVSGQTCDWVSAIDLFEHHERLIIEMPERVFKPFRMFAGTALNDPTKLNSVNFRSALRTTDTTDLRSRYSKLFGGVKNQSTFGRLCLRNTDWTVSHTRLEHLLKSGRIPSPKQVEKEVAEINEVLVKLFAAISNPNNDYRPTGTVVNEFAKLIEALAEEVTLYALYVNYIHQAVKAFDDGEKIIIKNT